MLPNLALLDTRGAHARTRGSEIGESAAGKQVVQETWDIYAARLADPALPVDEMKQILASIHKFCQTNMQFKAYCSNGAKWDDVFTSLERQYVATTYKNGRPISRYNQSDEAVPFEEFVQVVSAQILGSKFATRVMSERLMHFVCCKFALRHKKAVTNFSVFANLAEGLNSEESKWGPPDMMFARKQPNVGPQGLPGQVAAATRRRLEMFSNSAAANLFSRNDKLKGTVASRNFLEDPLYLAFRDAVNEVGNEVLLPHLEKQALHAAFYDPEADLFSIGTEVKTRWIVDGKITQKPEGEYKQYAQHLMMVVLRYKIELACVVRAFQEKQTHNSEEWLRKFAATLDFTSIDFTIDYEDFEFDLMLLLRIMLRMRKIVSTTRFAFDSDLPPPKTLFWESLDLKA